MVSCGILQSVQQAQPLFLSIPRWHRYSSAIPGTQLTLSGVSSDELEIGDGQIAFEMRRSYDLRCLPCIDTIMWSISVNIDGWSTLMQVSVQTPTAREVCIHLWQQHHRSRSLINSTSSIAPPHFHHVPQPYIILVPPRLAFLPQRLPHLVLSALRFILRFRCEKRRIRTNGDGETFESLSLYTVCWYLPEPVDERFTGRLFGRGVDAVF